MKRIGYLRGVLGLFLIATLVSAVAGCSGSTDGVTTETSLTAMTPARASVPGDPMLGAALTSDAASESLSTFKSKDPFIQQAVPASTSTTGTTTPGSGGVTSTTYSGTTTTYRYTTTTYHYTTTTKPPSTTTTAKPTTTTTAPHLHSLKILSISTVGGAAVVTFRVDNTTYKDKRAGDVVSTTWGQVKIVDISTSSKVVTLLHGSETLILGVGQSTYE